MRQSAGGCSKGSSMGGMDAAAGRVCALFVIFALWPSSVFGGNVYLIEYSASWCKPCQRMKPIVDRLKGEGYPIETRDFDKDRIRAKWLGVTAIPAFVVFSNGQRRLTVEGELSETDLRGLFVGRACDPAIPDPADSVPLLPGPDDEEEEPVPVRDLPPAPQPQALPSDHGPYDRKPQPLRLEAISDLFILSIPPEAQSGASSTRNAPPDSQKPSMPPAGDGTQPERTPDRSATGTSSANSGVESDPQNGPGPASQKSAAAAGSRSQTPGYSSADTASKQEDTVNEEAASSSARVPDSGFSWRGLFDFLAPMVGKAVLFGLGVTLPPAGGIWAYFKVAKAVASVVRWFRCRRQTAPVEPERQQTAAATEEAVSTTPTSRLPHLHSDYSNIWAETFEASGGNSQHEAIKLDLYIAAVELLRKGEIFPQANGKAIADALDDWVMKRFLDRIPKALPKSTDENILHKSLMGFLYREAVDRLRMGHIQMLGHRETADAIDRWVRKEFYRKIVKPTKPEEE